MSETVVYLLAAPEPKFARGLVRLATYCCLAAAVVIASLFVTLLVYGPNRAGEGALETVLVGFWLAATVLGLLSMLTGLIAGAWVILKQGLPREREWARAICCAAVMVCFLPLNVGIVRAALSLQRTHQITVVNKYTTPVWLQLTSGASLDFGEIPPSQSVTRQFRISQEGRLTAEVIVNGRTSRLELDEWVHPQKGAGRDRTLTVNADGTVTVADNLE